MTISTTDEALLTWYFSRGQSAFERSTSGPMLERAELFGSVGGRVWSDSKDEYVIRSERLRRPSSPWARVEDGEIVDMGYQISARPTAELRASSGYVPELTTVERYATVSAVLKAIERIDPRAGVALEAYYGDLGADWARRPKPGRIGALYHLTFAGETLLATAADEARAKGQPVAGSPARRMANEVAAKRTERRRIALLRADKQALALRATATAAWCEAKAELKARRAA